MKRKIMILGASILQLPAIEKARKLGMETIVVDINPDAVGFSVDGVVKEVISTVDIPSIVESAKRHDIDGIMTLATDMPIRAVAAVAREMKLVGIDEKTALRATNKVEMRVALEKNKVPIPKFFKVSNEEEYKKAVKEFNVPFIVKPVDSSGSRGVFEVLDITNQSLIERAYRYCRPFSSVGDVIVEEYMNGPEVSVETLSIDGVCHVIQITDKLTTGAPYYVEMGHSQPTRLGQDIVEKVVEVAKSANRAIGIKDGPSHIEIIVTDKGPKIVEIGARLGGDNINTHLVPLSTGIDIVECCIKIALGEKPEVKSKFNKGAAIRYFKQDAGVVSAIEGIEEAEKVPGIKQISIVHDIGEEITDIVNSGARLGFVIAQDADAESAIRDCERAMNQIKINII